MTDLKGIKGFTVQTFANDTASTLAETGTWSSDAPAPQTTQSGGSFGITTAAVSTGGYDGEAYVQTTIEFNGSAWSSGGSMNRPAGQSFNGLGTESSGGIAGGYKTSGNAVVNNFESYNGSAFTESTDLNTARQNSGSTGASNTAAIIVGGTTGVASPPDTTGNNNVEIWNGSSWTEIAEINTARYSQRALGSTCPAPTAVVAGGENSGTKTGITEEYDGSSWTEVADMNTAKSQGGAAGSVATDGIYFGGEGPASGGYTVYAQTEAWNGTSWTEVSDLSAARYSFSTATGTGSAAIAGQGRNPGFTGLTEIWTLSPTFTQINLGQVYFNSTSNTFKVTEQPVPGGTWASGANMSQPRGRAGFASNASSTTHIAMTFGGNVGAGTPGKTVNTEQYDGTSWTEVNNINTVRNGYGGCGTLTSSIYAGGEDPLVPPSNTANVELWDGTNWTETTNLNVARRSNVGFGATNTDVINASGYTTTSVAITEKWNGTSWTEVGDQNAAKYARGGAGTATDGILFGGQDPTTNTETWDGTSWTEVSELNSAGEYRAASGSSSSQVLATGKYPLGANVEAWNGSSWTEINDISTARWEGSGTGSAVFGLISGGHPGTPNNYATATEEFTVPETNNTITIS